MIPSENPVELIYVMGSARCGSTLFDMVLDLHPEIAGLGELNNLPHMAWQNDEMCACRLQASKCPFWSAVLERWLSSPGVRSVEHYISLMRRFERYSRIPWLLTHPRSRPAAFEDYAVHSRALFEAIRALSGARILVDSSKSPGRALALSMLDGFRITFVHLVRDVRGVVWSLRKSYAKNLEAGIQADLEGRPVWNAAALWAINNATSAGVRRGMRSRGVLVRYEDFVENPTATLARVGNTADFDPKSVNQLVTGTFQTLDRHTVAGNRLRMKREVSIRPDESWHDHLTAGDHATILAIAGWLMPTYKYDIRLR